MSETLTDYIMDLGECDHRPLTRPRAGHIGEAVFAERWKELMAEHGNLLDDDGESNWMLRKVLGYMACPITQRHASVAATFIKWLGTNCGQGFLCEARRMEEEYRNTTMEGRGFLFAWTDVSRRESWLDNGFRSLEHILATDDLRRNGQLRVKPDLSADDYEVAERIVVWLASKDGRQFVGRCEEAIKGRTLLEKIEKAAKAQDLNLIRFYAREIS